MAKPMGACIDFYYGQDLSNAQRMGTGEIYGILVDFHFGGSTENLK